MKVKLLKSFSKLVAVITLSAVVLVLKSGGTSAATYNVAAGSDGLNGGDLICTLSEAISNIDNGGNLYSDCGAPSGSDVISLPNQPINLTADLPASSRPYSVIGQGKDVSIINGAGYSAMFRISMGTESSSNSINFRDFTAKNISRGSGSVCISVSAGSASVAQILEATGLYLENCGAYGIYTSLWNSTALVDGVEISSDNTNNTVGIFPLRIGELTIKNTTIYGEAMGVHTFQGPISPGNSSAINSTINVYNSTFTNNRLALSLNASNSSNSEAAVALNLSLINNTIVGNSSTSSSGTWEGIGTSGVLWATGGNPTVNVSMKNNLLANNLFNGSLKNCYAGTSQYAVNVNVSSMNNLSDDTCSNKLGGSDFTNVSGITSTLDALSNNGGPVKTMALLIGSPAIDQGTSVTEVITDARGVVRPQNAIYDIGAYEKTVPGVEDPDPVPEDPQNPGPPGSIAATPKAPRTGKLIGALLASISIIALLVLVSKEIINGRIKVSKSER